MQVKRVRLRSQDLDARESSDYKELRHGPGASKCDSGTVACIQSLRSPKCGVSD